MPTTITAFGKLHSHSQYDRSRHLETCTPMVEDALERTQARPPYHRPLAHSPAQSAPSSWPAVVPMHPPGPPWCREELLADRPIAAGLPRRKLVAEWLRQNLLEGTRTQYNIEAAAQRDGVCITTLRRAKFDL